MFEADTDFTASTPDEMTFKIGDVLEVLEKSLEGWWYAKYVMLYFDFYRFMQVNIVFLQSAKPRYHSRVCSKPAFTARNSICGNINLTVAE